MQYNIQPILKIFMCILYLYIQLNSTLASDRIEIPSSPNPVEAGARALGMGGAFIAIADDATAASWNPGGLIQLERPEISFVWAGFHRIEDNTFCNESEASGMQSVSGNRLNYLSAAFPFSFWDRNIVISVTYQNLYDFAKKWNFPMINSEENWSEDDIDYELTGSLSAIGIAYAFQITRRLSFGFTFNIWEDGLYDNRWKDKRIIKSSGMDRGDKFIRETCSIDKYSFSGFNINVGLLLNITDKLTIGTVLKTPFKSDVMREHSLESSTKYLCTGIS